MSETVTKNAKELLTALEEFRENRNTTEFRTSKSGKKTLIWSQKPASTSHPSINLVCSPNDGAILVSPSFGNTVKPETILEILQVFGSKDGQLLLKSIIKLNESLPQPTKGSGKGFI